MKAKLVKTVTDNYILVDPTKEFYGEGYVLGTTVVSDAPRLSLKNCEAIERGYDLDELFNDVDESIDYHEFDFTSFRLGFQKALEILGDKTFSEEDIREAFAVARHIGKNSIAYEFEEWFDRHMKQQTEWDVEIVMEEVSIGDKYTPEPKPKLDADGRLILKRVV
jgi:hypothetical protein